MWIGTVLSAQYFGVVLGSVFWGRLSDFLGVRRVYILLLVLDTVLFSLSAVTTSPEFLAVVRGLAGFCAIMPLGIAWVSAAAPPEKQMQAFTLLMVFVLTGFISGAVISGAFGQIKTDFFLEDSSWFSGVIVSAVMCVIVLLLIVLGTAPPKARAVGEEQGKPEGVLQATMTIEFLACAFTSFLGAQEGGVSMVAMTTLLTSAEPLGFGLSEGQMGLANISTACAVMGSSLFFAGWLSARTHPQQRVVVLGIATNTCLLMMTLIMYSWNESG
jgi:MFS family permease